VKFTGFHLPEFRCPGILKSVDLKYGEILFFSVYRIFGISQVEALFKKSCERADKSNIRFIRRKKAAEKSSLFS